MERHRSKYKQYLKGKEHTKTRSFVLFEEYGIDNCKIELIENCPCSTKEDLHRREGVFIKQTECVNKIVAGRTVEEYRKQNAEKVKERLIEYKKQNPEKIKEQKTKKKTLEAKPGILPAQRQRKIPAGK